MWEQPVSLPLNGALRGLALWPCSLCCQHFGRFVCDFIRNQNNRQMKRSEMEICKVLLQYVLLTLDAIHTASRVHIKHPITEHIIGACLSSSESSERAQWTAAAWRRLLSPPRSSRIFYTRHSFSFNVGEKMIWCVKPLTFSRFWTRLFQNKSRLWSLTALLPDALLPEINQMSHHKESHREKLRAKLWDKHKHTQTYNQTHTHTHNQTKHNGHVFCLNMF